MDLDGSGLGEAKSPYHTKWIRSGLWASSPACDVRHRWDHGFIPDQVVTQVSQRGCGVSLLRDIQKPSGCDPGQLALGPWLSRGIRQGDLQRSFPTSQLLEILILWVAIRLVPCLWPSIGRYVCYRIAVYASRDEKGMLEVCCFEREGNKWYWTSFLLGETT